MKNILATEKLIKPSVMFMRVSDFVIMPPVIVNIAPDVVNKPPEIVNMTPVKLMMPPDRDIRVSEKLKMALFGVILRGSIGNGVVRL